MSVVVRRLAVALITVYRYTLAALLGGQCRFWPSCSRYAEEAIVRHGVWRGAGLAVRRVLRCHPWHRGGVDLVPEVTVQGGPPGACQSSAKPNTYGRASASPLSFKSLTTPQLRTGGAGSFASTPSYESHHYHPPERLLPERVAASVRPKAHRKGVGGAPA